MSRTTIRDTLAALITRMQSDLIGDPPTPAAPFRRVLVGEVSPGVVPRPFVALAARGAEPIGTIDGDKLMALSLELLVVVDVVGDTTHATIFDAVGAIDDFFDGMLNDGFVEGADGFDDRTWTVSYPRSQAGGRVATARAVQRAILRVGRMNNRVPVGQGS